MPLPWMLDSASCVPLRPEVNVLPTSVSRESVAGTFTPAAVATAWLSAAATHYNLVSLTLGKPT